jgi:undecaprenyl-diphosphatase
MNWSQLLELDARFSARLRVAERPGRLRTMAGILAHSGDSWFWLVGLAVLWATNQPFWRARALVMAAGIFVTAILVLLMKFTIRRRRPEGEWGGIYRKSDPHSFPSGHAARSVMLAVLALGLGPAWFGLVLAIWAPLVAAARVSMGVHYLSDVLAGAAIGLLMGGLVLQFNPLEV